MQESENCWLISFLVLSVFLFASFISYLIDGQIDQDKIGKFSNEIENVGGSLGNNLAHQFLYNWFGVSSFLIPFMMLLIGLKWAFEKQLLALENYSSIHFVIFWTFLFGVIFYGTFHIEWCIWLSNEHLAGHITWKDWNWTTSYQPKRLYCCKI